MKNKKTETLALISGKGGSGKTILALSIAKLLADCDFKVLLIDCDLATHGASYFYEDYLRRNTCSVIKLLESSNTFDIIMKTKDGFDFIPSSSTPEDIKEQTSREFKFRVILKNRRIFNDYDFVIFDCQAGVSSFVREVVSIAQKKLIVLEPDAVSSAALRILFLQLSDHMQKSTVWQVFNKITEEEREVYSKVAGGMLFNNLPPIPFDWKVRASFATSDIPKINDRGSAFGLALMRLLKPIFKDHISIFEKIEKERVGDWHKEIMFKLKILSDKKKDLLTYNSYKKKNLRIKKSVFFSMTIAILGVGVSFLSVVRGYLKVSYADTFLPLLSGFGIASIAVIWVLLTKREIELDYKNQKELININEIEKELEKYETLLATDPWLSEYVRSQEMKEMMDNWPSVKPDMLKPGAILDCENMYKTDLAKMDLRGISLKGTNLSRAYVDNANLEEAKLVRANLTNSSMRNTCLKNADLEQANAAYSDLEFADLGEANLTEADFTGANLKGANLDRANLMGANFSECLGLNKASFTDAKYDVNTKWPEGYDFKSIGAIYVG